MKRIIDVIFVLGPPGSGKSTQCNKIQENFGNFIYIAAGELLRNECKKEDSVYSEVIQDHIKSGRFVPSEIVFSLIENAINSYENVKYFETKTKIFLIDGFPRSQLNLDYWNEKMGSESNLIRVFSFDCSSEICVERCEKRFLTTARDDDKEQVIVKRCKSFKETSYPIIEHFNNLGLVDHIDAELSESKVFEQIISLIDNIFHSFVRK